MPSPGGSVSLSMDLLNAATCLDLRSLYPHDAHPEPVLIGRRELERCARATLERAMLDGGSIERLSLAFLEAVDLLSSGGQLASSANEDDLSRVLGPSLSSLLASSSSPRSSSAGGEGHDDDDGR